VRQGSGVYRFKGSPPGGAKAASDAAAGGETETDGNDAGVKVDAKAAAEGGLYIGEWNAGFMQGLGILKYDDGERYHAVSNA
jgi:hypothetical protein